MTRHLRIRDDELFRAQARIGTLAEIIRDDVVYLLEREAMDADPDWMALQQHGVEVMKQRINHNIDRIRDELTLVRRRLNRSSKHD